MVSSEPVYIYLEIKKWRHQSNGDMQSPTCHHTMQYRRGKMSIYLPAAMSPRQAVDTYTYLPSQHKVHTVYFSQHLQQKPQ